MAPALKPFQLLEINVISAQDLESVSNKMHTYATAWVNPNRKLSSCVDTEGKINPTWNDKFVFRVDDEFLRQDSSAVKIEIYAVHWFRDKLVGTIRVLVGNLIPPPALSRHNHHTGTRFVSLQVRRPSGRPQGILNIGVALLDGSMRSMPLYRQLSSSAVGYRDLMDDLPPNLRQNNAHNKTNHPNHVKPILRRTKSERSERVTFNNSPAGSIVAVPMGKTGAKKESSIISISDQYVDPFKGMKKKGRASSVISGAELREKPKHKGNHKKGKASSVVSDSVLSTKEPSVLLKMENPGLKNKEPKIEEKMNKVDVKDEKSKNTETSPIPLQMIAKPISKYNKGYEYGVTKGKYAIGATKGKYAIGAPVKGNSIWSDSEVGPSPSEVAAAIAEKRYPLQDNQSSVVSGWSLDESVEGLRSKLERWRNELPPLYDHGGFSSSSYRSSGQHARSYTDPGSGLFSCFGNIYGYECQCVCGKPPEKRRRRRRFRSPSVGTSGQSFL